MAVELDWESGSIAPNGHPAFPIPPRRKWPWVVFAIIILISAIVYATVHLRLEQVEDWQLRTLRDTAVAEVTALRIGDENAFLALQHQGDEVWLAHQRDYFRTVQNTRNLFLSGEILESKIATNGLLGIVRILEIENEIPFERLWFYWNFDDLGWRHLPQNTELWGDTKNLSVEGVEIEYRSRDEELAQQLARVLPNWLKMGCETLACEKTPIWHIEITPDPSLILSWDALASWNLRIPSPYLTRVRSDMPFSTEMRAAVADFVSERLIDSSALAIVPSLDEDALYLRQAVKSWLTGNYTGQNDSSPLLQSIAEQFEIATIGALIQNRDELALLPALRKITNASLVELSLLDWRDYLEWQLKRVDPGFNGKITSLSASNDKETIQLLAKALYPENSEPGPSQIRFVLIGDHWQMLPE